MKLLVNKYRPGGDLAALFDLETAARSGLLYGVSEAPVGRHDLPLRHLRALFRSERDAREYYEEKTQMVHKYRFIPYTGRSQRFQTRTDIAYWGGSGNMSLPPNAREYLKSGHICLGYDPEAGVISVRDAKDSDLGRLILQAASPGRVACISMRGFATEFGLEPAPKRRYRAFWDTDEQIMILEPIQDSESLGGQITSAADKNGQRPIAGVVR